MIIFLAIYIDTLTYQMTSAQILSSRIPAILREIEKSDHDLSSLLYIQVGGSMLPANHIVEKFISKFPNLKSFQSGYGSTETGFISYQPYSLPILEYKSVGIPIPGVSYKIVDRKTGNILGANEIGEVHAKTSQNKYARYLDRDKCEFMDMDGFFKTGDCGFYDSEGQLQISGRYKEVISCDGYDVYPSEFENIISAHDSVSEVAVIGVDHAEFGQTAQAFVVLKSDSNHEVSAEQLVEYHNKLVGDYYKKMKTGMVKFVDMLPKTFKGKIDKKNLIKSL